MANVGTAMVENLLRVARSEVAAGTTFVALVSAAGPPEIVSVPAAGPSDALSSGELSELARQAAEDPEFPYAPVLVRSVQMGVEPDRQSGVDARQQTGEETGRALTLAVAPLRDGEGGHSMIGVVAGPGHRFEPTQLDVLERLGQRLSRHLRVVRHLGGERPMEGAPGADAADRSGATFESVSAGEVPGDVPDGQRALPAGQIGPPEGAPPGVSPATWWAGPDPVTGLPSLGQFFARAGRMLAADGRTAGGLALVLVELADRRTAPGAARAVRAQLRFSDPVARVDWDLLAVAIALLPGGTGEAIEQRLAAAVRSALGQAVAVRTVHVVARPGDRREVDELLDEAVSRLPGRR